MPDGVKGEVLLFHGKVRVIGRDGGTRGGGGGGGKE